MIKGEIERTCSLCRRKFKCEYEDEMTKAFAEMWEICPDCWDKFQVVETGGDDTKNSKR